MKARKPGLLAGDPLIANPAQQAPDAAPGLSGLPEPVKNLVVRRSRTSNPFGRYQTRQRDFDLSTVCFPVRAAHRQDYVYKMRHRPLREIISGPGQGGFQARVIVHDGPMQRCGQIILKSPPEDAETGSQFLRERG